MVSISELGSIMAIFAHPDDESFTCGGLLAMAAQNGQAVVCITATKGEAGVQDENRWPREHLDDIRQAEMEESLRVLGIKNHHWLGYKDGQCDQIPDKEAVEKLIEYINKYKPDTIITFAPDGLTGHPDHKKVSSWSLEATKNLGSPIQVYFSFVSKQQYEKYFKDLDQQFNIYFAIDKPKLINEAKSDIVLNLRPDVLNHKIKGLTAHESQMDKMFKTMGEAWFKEAFKTESFINADRKDINWQA